MEPIPRHDPALIPKAGAVAALVILLAAVLALFYQARTAVPQDHRVDKLVANFQANRESFRKIAALSSVDATFAIDVSYGDLGSNELTAGAVPHYREILDALDAIGAEHVSAADHALNVDTMAEGLAVSGRQSGYFYTTASDVETVTIDVARSEDAPRTWLYPLGDGWYASDYRF